MQIDRENIITFEFLGKFGLFKLLVSKIDHELLKKKVLIVGQYSRHQTFGKLFQVILSCSEPYYNGPENPKWTEYTYNRYKF